ncbi:MAG TPA: hypothetical protein VJ729_01825 [Nitrososphaeraceae archaeon]|nr:hypothetical protein [Nitrososphaeraceae archaeon]
MSNENIDTNKVFTRKQKEELVLDLYFNHNKTYNEIAKIARISLRDIKPIVDKAYQEKERQEHKSLQVQTYELFSQGKTPLQVAIDLNIGEGPATQYHSEYLRLVQLDAVTKIYLELKGDVWYFVSLCKAAKTAKMNVSHVVKLLHIANSGLPTTQFLYDQLQKRIDILKLNKANLNTEAEYLEERIATSRLTLDSIIQDCDRETARLLQLQEQKRRQESLVKHFENDNEEYTKIAKTVKDNVYHYLSNVRTLLNVALMSIIESFRDDPNKYNSLVLSLHADKDNVNTQQVSHGYDSDYCKTILLEQSEKLYSSLVDILEKEIINGYSSKPAAFVPPPSSSALQLEENKQQ